MTELREDAWGQWDGPACPRGDIAHCPLYIESHIGRGFGCVDDMARPCKVQRREMNFQTAILELCRHGIAHPGMIEAIATVGRRQ